MRAHMISLLQKTKGTNLFCRCSPLQTFASLFQQGCQWGCYDIIKPHEFHVHMKFALLPLDINLVFKEPGACWMCVAKSGEYIRILSMYANMNFPSMSCRTSLTKQWNASGTKDSPYGITQYLKGPEVVLKVVFHSSSSWMQTRL